MSSSKLEAYRSAQQPIPDRMLRWHLYGSGLERLGRDGRPEDVPVPEYGPDELLVRQDACGLCFSDTKVIGLGENHPRMTGRNLAADPVTLGHEVSCTVVGVGENLRDRFRVGERYVVQADVFYRGKSMAYGYAISGGLAEYSVISTPIIDGDEGCYLLPVRPDTGYVESALTEPWACVVSAYAQAHRAGVRPGGRLLVVAGDGGGGTYEWGRTLTAASLPALVATAGPEGAALDGVAEAAAALGVPVQRLALGDVAALKADLTEGAGFDDIIVLAAVEPETIESLATALADHGILNLVGDRSLPRKLSLDIGRIHYNWHYYLGTSTIDPADAYFETRSADLLAGGVAWFIGAGGPMGQMHVQRAVQHAHPPRRIVATDVDVERLQSVIDRFGGTARERSIDLVAINPKELTPDAFNAELRRLSDGKGFSDIVSMVPVAALIEHAGAFLAEGGWFNIFAGVARGTMAQIDVNAIGHGRARYIGSSGSSLSDMRETLRRVESDELSTNASLAAIGGMAAAKEGLQAVKEGWFPGKTLIFPLIHDLPLTPLPELRERYPTVYARMKDGQFWTQEAEDELLRLLL
ncbi:MAG TPA: alcohol dehydrogenase catalytic domain-containing protein [Chthonomonadaceae bacterium]|nr:alcohol dehydrogenase catalytic domain-containing protein [Chthonomonadaceae bacterium]